MKLDKPTSRLKPQAQVNLPVNGDNTIMDDTVMTMDGNALMGGKTVTESVMRQSIVKTVPTAKIRLRR